MDSKNVTKLNHTEEIAECGKIPLFTIEQRDQNKEPLDGLTISQIRKAVFGTVGGRWISSQNKRSSDSRSFSKT